ncbi:hypothetical protein LPJ61_005188 [Coemansia biformis]|uniref:Uncharacterized protein n=1 Tax=Coemansia biformis TaxID=1286918 RepID=A0A9W7Y9B8_9FUNG|nr:hypothetical protein LPJ61_005188 [Coemansia biformis]
MTNVLLSLIATTISVALLLGQLVDIDVDLAQIMPLPDDDVYEGFYEDTWSDLNKKELLK